MSTSLFRAFKNTRLTAAQAAELRRSGRIEFSKASGTRLLVYFDDAGQYGEKRGAESTPAQVIAGFAATFEQWQILDWEWRTVLRRPDFELDYFHMRELLQSKGRFEKFRTNRRLQERLLNHLMGIIKTRTLGAFGGTVEVSAWDTVNAEFEVKEHYKAPVVLAAELAVSHLFRWLKTQPPVDSVYILLDKGFKHRGLVIDRIWKTFGMHVNLVAMKENTPIQAADLLAWSLHRAISGPTSPKVVDGDTRTWIQRPRWEFQSLMQHFGTVVENDVNYSKMCTTWGIIKADELRDLCAREGVRKRR